MARNVGKTHMEENLGKTLSMHQGKIILGLALLVLALLAYSSRDYFLQYQGVVGTVGLDDLHYTVRKRTRKKIQLTCALIRYDGATESTKLCSENPEEFKYLKPRHRFVKPRFKRYMIAVGEEIEVPWLKEELQSVEMSPADGTPPKQGSDQGSKPARDDAPRSDEDAGDAVASRSQEDAGH